MEAERRIFTRDEIYQKLISALTEKAPRPPAGWCASLLDEEVRKATREYEPDSYLRQKDALNTCLFYLVDFAARMPEWIDTTESNERVKKTCCELADEIEKITIRPDEVIEKHGKLKVWLKAILAVQTCFIYREETERAIAREEDAKRAAKLSPPKHNSLFDSPPRQEKWKSDLAKNIFLKVADKRKEKPSEQPSLF